MAENDKERLEESLKGYKEKISPITRVALRWERELVFVGRTAEGYEIEFDARVQWGCKPTDSFLLSLAGCMGVDVVVFLQKMKAEIADLKIDLMGERNPTPPQYIKAVEMTLHIAGKNLTTKKVDRAISLSHEKYCSVYNSLRKDMDVKVKYSLEEKEPMERIGD
ncbi:OsmC family protein [Thermodesulfovibrionales bacterium]|nr:OsmC family protein [Thermodesulfovibrionales bacterium]MCL0050066.1 OsmC family protein [Thermodesulfovibrionales bacterium]MCL0068639.1 OsmC family protein [Thermodesulfovibrionales bacterium]